jgi:integrator complex subunit 5
LFPIAKRDPDHQDLAQIIEHLQTLANSATGLPIVLRSLCKGALSSSIAASLFGGGGQDGLQPLKVKSASLYDENLKFGSMPTHPLGTSTVFHAGVIGDGKRKVRVAPKETEVTRENGLVFVAILFKICDEVTAVTKEEAYKQLALLLIDHICPDVMYNGLPWPDEDFTRVTMERDLQIAKKLEDSPIMWKILWGLAEARPALCYCSVILRGALAVQMAYWSAALRPSPTTLEMTKKILWLMSVGQFLPPPLNSVADVIHVFHPYQVHCVLVDVWNYVRDNVPSPAAFVTNGKGLRTRKFGPYINHKQYCDRLRLIMMQHIGQVSKEYQQFFVVNHELREQQHADEDVIIIPS